MDVKPVETLVLANCGINKLNNGTKCSDISDIRKNRKEDEHITTAVMKVLEGYDWNLVQPTQK